MSPISFRFAISREKCVKNMTSKQRVKNWFDSLFRKKSKKINKMSFQCFNYKHTSSMRRPKSANRMLFLIELAVHKLLKYCSYNFIENTKNPRQTRKARIICSRRLWIVFLKFISIQRQLPQSCCCPSFGLLELCTIFYCRDTERCRVLLPSSRGHTVVPSTSSTQRVKSLRWIAIHGHLE